MVHMYHGICTQYFDVASASEKHPWAVELLVQHSEIAVGRNMRKIRLWMICDTRTESLHELRDHGKAFLLDHRQNLSMDTPCFKLTNAALQSGLI